MVGFSCILKESNKKSPAKFLAYNLSQKMNGALFRLESSFFLRVTFFSCNHHFFLNLQVLKKPKKKAVKKMLRQDR